MRPRARRAMKSASLKSKIPQLYATSVRARLSRTTRVLWLNRSQMASPGPIVIRKTSRWEPGGAPASTPDGVPLWAPTGAGPITATDATSARHKTGRSALAKLDLPALPG